MQRSAGRRTRSPAARNAGSILRGRFGGRAVLSCWTSRLPDWTKKRASEKQIVQLPCDILIVAMHNYSPEFLDSFTKVLRIRDGELEP